MQSVHHYLFISVLVDSLGTMSSVSTVGKSSVVTMKVTVTPPKKSMSPCQGHQSDLKEGEEKVCLSFSPPPVSTVSPARSCFIFKSCGHVRRGEDSELCLIHLREERQLGPPSLTLSPTLSLTLRPHFAPQDHFYMQTIFDRYPATG